MIDIKREERDKYFRDDTKKEICIRVEDNPGNITNINWYIWHYEKTTRFTSSSSVTIFTAWHDEINQQYLKYADYLYFSCRVEGSYSTLYGKNLILQVLRSGHVISKNYWVKIEEDTWTSDAVRLGKLRLFCRIEKDDIYSFCKGGDPEYGGGSSYPYGVLQIFPYNPAEDYASITISDLQLQCEYNNYTFDELYPQENRLDYKLPYLGLSSFARNNTITAIVRRPSHSIEPITNENIYTESQRLTERICSADTLKIGSSEASQYEISIMDRHENLNGQCLSPYISTRRMQENVQPFDYSEINWVVGNPNGYKPDEPSEYEWDTINLQTSRFLVDDDFLRINTSYFTKKDAIGIKFKFTVTHAHSDPVSVRAIRVSILYYLEGDMYPQTDYRDFSLSQCTSGNYATMQRVYDVYNMHHEAIEKFGIKFSLLDSQREEIGVGTGDLTVLFDEVQVMSLNSIYSSFPTYDTEYNIEWRGNHIEQYINERQLSFIDYHEDTVGIIPLGKFYVDTNNVQSAITYKRNDIVAYDQLITLSVNAANWYKMYMFGISLDGYSRGGFEYVRQMYSTYWNIISALMLDSRANHKEEVIFEQDDPWYAESDIQIPGTEDYYGRIQKSWDIGEDLDWFFNRLWFAEETYNFGSDEKKALLKHPFVVDIWYKYSLNYHYGELQGGHYVYSSYRKFVDEYGRGIFNRACILIEEVLDDGTRNKFCVDNGDYFMLSPNCAYVYIRWSCTQFPHADDAGIYKFTGGDSHHPGFILSSVRDMTPSLINASTRLAYYNYETKELFDADNGITARDVVRSLMEINGCFLNSNRYGELEFKYLTKRGSYPSTDLYPSPYLYPKGSSENLLKSNYLKSNYADYKVKEYGKIQIRKMNAQDNSLDSIVQWEYVGDPKLDNTYVIDDNVFYSGTNMVYNVSGMPEVNKMLANMFTKISDLGYTPNVTTAIGMPWLEAGDRVRILTETGGFESCILRRTLEGIHLLKDTYESYGEEVEPFVESYAINTYKDTQIRPYRL